MCCHYYYFPQFPGNGLSGAAGVLVRQHVGEEYAKENASVPIQLHQMAVLPVQERIETMRPVILISVVQVSNSITLTLLV